MSKLQCRMNPASGGDVRMRPAAPGCEDYAGAERGLMSCDDDGALTTTNETEERLVFAERGTA